jgi:hypothetical protein
MIEKKPEEPNELWESDLENLVLRPFIQEACFPEHADYTYTLERGLEGQAVLTPTAKVT